MPRPPCFFHCSQFRAQNKVKKPSAHATAARPDGAVGPVRMQGTPPVVVNCSALGDDPEGRAALRRAGGAQAAEGFCNDIHLFQTVRFLL